MENIYNTSKTSRYPECICVLIDILGFSDAVRKSANFNFEDSYLEYKRINELLTNLTAIKNLWLENSREIKISSFSDTHFISCSEVSEQLLDKILLLISRYFLTAISCQFFFRGALTIGGCQESKDGIIFGPACVLAHEMEENDAHWPCCIIDPHSLEYIYPNNSWKKYNHYILSDSDGIPYFDYLGYAFANLLVSSYIEMKENTKTAYDNLRIVPETLLKALSGHKKAVYQAVKESNKELYLFSKYHSLAVYHNNVINRILSDENDPDYFNHIKDDIEYLTGKELSKNSIQEFLPTLRTYREKWEIQWKQQKIDTEKLFNIFYSEHNR